MEYRAASLRRRTTISRMTSFYINQLSLRSALLEEHGDPVDDFRRTRLVLNDSARLRDSSTRRLTSISNAAARKTANRK
jgi:hypothetical protein